MAELSELLKLELDLLITMAVGFAAFRIAYAERADPTNTAQTIFLSICFAAIFRLLLSTILLCQWPELLCIVLAAVAALCIAILWRTHGMLIYGKLWKKGGRTHIDGLNSVLNSIRLSSEFKPVSLLVYTTAGQKLMCDSMKEFKDMPFGPCLFGPDGSIAFYVTHFKTANSEE